jgi:uncharacterized protein (TIGR02246 family)
MSDDRASVEAFYGTFTDAWKSNDAGQVAGHFAEDGTLINPFGQRADGREAVEAMYAEYFGTILRGSETSVRLDSVRSVEADHVFVDGDQSVVGSDGAALFELHISALSRRDGDSWRFVDVRPFTVLPPPG